MIPVSKAFRQALFHGDRTYQLFVRVTLRGEDKVFELENKDLWSSGVSIDDAVSSDEAFGALGATIINSVSLTIDNTAETYTPYDFNGAKLEIWVGKTLYDTETPRLEKIKKGVFLVDDPFLSGPLLQLYCLDYMSLLDTPYAASSLVYPKTLLQIVQDICTRAGVQLATLDFPHHDYMIQERPGDETTTDREVLSWVATLAGCYARFNRDGELELSWFDQQAINARQADIDGGSFDTSTPHYSTGANVEGGAFSPWADGTETEGGTFTEAEKFHYLQSAFQRDIGVDDTVVTGVTAYVKMENEDGEEEIKAFTSGRAGYTIEIRDNALLTPDNAQTVVNWLGIQLIGLQFRKASLVHLSDPTIEAGDLALAADWKGREHLILVTRTAFNTSGRQQTVSASEPPSRNSAARFSSATKAYVAARKLVKQEKTKRDLALEKLAEKLEAAPGLYCTVEAADSGSIYYLHDKPTVADSDILWKMNSEAWAVSTDGGDTWNAGLTVDGDMIVRILTAIGINADWINAGTVSADRIELQYREGILSDASMAVDTKLQSYSKTTDFTVAPGQIRAAINSAKNDVQTLFEEQLGEIELAVSEKVGEDELIAKINAQPGALQIAANKLNLNGAISANDCFKINPDGSFEANQGRISAFQVYPDYIYLSKKSGGIIQDDYDTINSIYEKVLRLGKALKSRIMLSDIGITAIEDQKAASLLGSRLIFHLHECSDADLSQYGDFNPAVISYDQLRTNLGDGSTRYNYHWSGYMRFQGVSGGWILSLQDDTLFSDRGALVNGDISCWENCYVAGDLSVSGTKKRVVDSENYGTISQYAYETATPFFGDIGSAKIGKDGIATVCMDPVFAETVEHEDIHVFLQAVGENQVYLKNVSASHFEVAGTPGACFSWELKARQKNYAGVRLEDISAKVTCNSVLDTGAEEKFMNESEIDPYTLYMNEDLFSLEGGYA